MHREGMFVMPNPWDIGSARLLTSLGFHALATTSSGFAASLGRGDRASNLAELERHVSELVAAVDVPLNVDAEHGFGDDPETVADTVRCMGAIGAAGVSIEDCDPTGRPYAVGHAVERVAAAVEAATESGIVLTARADSHFHGHGDIADTLARFRGFADVGAEVLYAPGVNAVDEIRQLVEATDRPINVLAQDSTPDVATLARLGVRRVSMGGSLAFVAYGALARAARELLDRGEYGYLEGVLGLDDRRRMTADRPVGGVR